MTAAVQMPLFVFADFADYTVTWLAAHPLALLLTVAGTLACGFVALLWHDTRDDDRSEMDDSEPTRVKVVQIKDGAEITYGGAEYERLVADYVAKSQDASAAQQRVWDAFKQAQDDVKAQRAARDRNRKERA